jgi:hypothetical protein
MTVQSTPRTFDRCVGEFMNIAWIADVASSSGLVSHPMFSPASV